jgi:hypothetical protein
MTTPRIESADERARTTADLSEAPKVIGEPAPAQRATPYAFYALVVLTAANFLSRPAKRFHHCQRSEWFPWVWW